MSNKVLITNSQKAVKVPSGLRILIRRACNAVLEFEHFEAPAEISVTFVDNAAIAELNNQYRNKPMPTDVLSFPLGVDGKYDVDENNGCKMLGDIVISMERAQEQATLYGHPLHKRVGTTGGRCQRLQCRRHRRRIAPDRHRNGASDGGRTLCENRRNRDFYPLTRPMQGQRTGRGGSRRQTPKRTKHLRRRSEFSGRQNDDQKH